jgi:hypothetical protein
MKDDVSLPPTTGINTESVAPEVSVPQGAVPVPVNGSNVSIDATGKQRTLILIAGLVSGLMTLLFFMLLVVAALFERQVPSGTRFLVIIVLAFGAAMSASFLGGVAAAEGSVPIPGAEQNVIAFSVGGGVAVLVIVLLVGYFFYVRPTNLTSNRVVIPVPSTVEGRIEVFNETTAQIADVGVVITNGERRYIYAEFLPDQVKGRIRLEHVNGPIIDKAVYEITLEGALNRLESKQ